MKQSKHHTLALLLLWATPTFAQDLPSIDELMLGDIDITATTSTDTAPRWYDNLHWSLAYLTGTPVDTPEHVNSQRLDTRLRMAQLFAGDLYFNGDGKLILRGPLDQQTAADEQIAADLRLRELSLQWGSPRYSIKLGYQSLIWGEMDGTPISDVMTPWDYSEFAFTSPEDARVGQPMAVLDLFTSYGKWQLAYTPLPYTNRYPNGDAGALLSFVLGTDNYHVDEQTPKALRDYELGLRWRKTFGPSDLSLMLANLISDDPLFAQQQGDNIDTLNFTATYHRYQMAAATANYANGNFLYKLEAAYKQGRYFPGAPAIIRDTVETAVGLDYNANGAYNVTVELNNQHLLAGDGDLIGMQIDNSQLVARWSKNFLHDTLSAVLFASRQLQYGDIVQSGNLGYAINDYTRMDLNIAVFTIENQDSPMRFTDEWDQLSLRLTMDF